MSQNCALCAAGRDGYIITFPTSEVGRTVLATVPKEYAPRLQVISDVSTWFELRLIYDYLPYWLEFAEPAKWEFLRTNRTRHGQYIQGEPATFGQVVERKPAMWVEEAIAENRIRMMYQPIVSLDEQSAIGYELLARGTSPTGDTISPFMLYQSAREQNALFRLDRACRIAGITAGEALAQEKLMFINFIPTSIYVPEHCLQTTLAAAKEHGISHSRVVFEVVETDRVEDIDHLKRILKYYRAQGFRYALDDVGEGYNNLEMLKALEPDVVKLDRKFVSNLQFDTEKRRAAQEVLRLSTSMNAIALAEGVEHPEEARILGEMGYRWQQGYWYGRPEWQPQEANMTRSQTS